VLIYIASFAGLLGAVVLAVVYAADRYEREPIELIQNCFLIGFVGQLALVIAVTTVTGRFMWSGSWLLITVVGAALVMSYHVRHLSEMDERFDGIVYTVACLAGAATVIHLNNLPQVVAGSPFRDALDDGAVPGLRDLLIVEASPGFVIELGQGMTVILAGVLIGAVLGVLHLRGQKPGRIAFVCATVGLVTIGADVISAGAWAVRCLLAVAAIAAAIVIKRRSVFKERPEPAERDVLIMAVKTVLMVLGAALLATVLLQMLAPLAEVANDSGFGLPADAWDTGFTAGRKSTA